MYMAKKIKGKKHKMSKTVLWVEWCTVCGYMHMPELEYEVRAGDTSAHPSPYLEL